MSHRGYIPSAQQRIFDQLQDFDRRITGLERTRSRFSTGPAAPANADGRAGDFHYDTDEQGFYARSDDLWVGVGLPRQESEGVAQLSMTTPDIRYEHPNMARITLTTIAGGSLGIYASADLRKSKCFMRSNPVGIGVDGLRLMQGKTAGVWCKRATQGVEGFLVEPDGPRGEGGMFLMKEGATTTTREYWVEFESQAGDGTGAAKNVKLMLMSL